MNGAQFKYMNIGDLVDFCVICVFVLTGETLTQHSCDPVR